MSTEFGRMNLLDGMERRKLANAGLLLQRYLTVASSDKGKLPDGRSVSAVAKTDLYSAARSALGQTHDLYTVAYTRRYSQLNSDSTQRLITTFAMQTVPGSRLIIGLGAESPTDTALTLHSLYGVPFIPGSAIKGVAVHYAEEMGVGEHELGVIFGLKSDSGRIIFHDAWIAPDDVKSADNTLLNDVMTPHHGDYYGEKTNFQNGLRVAPTDFDDPVPVPFLSVRGKFHFALSIAVDARDESVS